MSLWLPDANRLKRVIIAKVIIFVHVQATAVNGYEKILSPPLMKQDICYWMNCEAVRRSRPEMCCINAAVEATALNDRALFKLTLQDGFIQDNITYVNRSDISRIFSKLTELQSLCVHCREEDTLVVSIGGNDIVQQPLLCTIMSMMAILCCQPSTWVERYIVCIQSTPTSSRLSSLTHSHRTLRTGTRVLARQT